MLGQKRIEPSSIIINTIASSMLQKVAAEEKACARSGKVMGQS
jgi:hypothetical protein